MPALAMERVCCSWSVCERERGRGREREGDGESESECVCVCVCVRERERERERAIERVSEREGRCMSFVVHSACYHDFVEDGSRAVVHFVKLINTTDTVITQHQCPPSEREREREGRERCRCPLYMWQ